MMICKACGKSDIANGAKFCPQCGNKLNILKDCTFCNFKNIPIEALFCPACGKKFEITTPKSQHLKPLDYCGESINLNGRQAADLGAGIAWSLQNIGANHYFDLGTFYSWGDPTRKTINSKLGNWFSGAPRVPDICSSNFDMASYNWGGSWRLPTCEECIELTQYDWETLSFRGQLVYKISSWHNHNYILLPMSMKLWIGDRAFGGKVHYLDIAKRKVCCEDYDVDHLYYVRAVANVNH